MRLQMRSMTDETFHIVQQNAILGASGMIVFTSLVFLFIWVLETVTGSTICFRCLRSVYVCEQGSIILGANKLKKV